MATAEVMRQPTMMEPTLDSAATNPVKTSKRKLETARFTPNIHLDFEAPERVFTMEDIGFDKDTGISPVAVSQPFRLFSDEAIEIFREEVLSDIVKANCQYESNLAPCQLRGYAPKYAPFTYDAWRNPETLAIVSKVAGVELVPNMNLEIGHINISVKSTEQTQSELESIEREKKSFEADEGIAGCPWEDDKPVVGWHTDSYPFVCVTMLSDCASMVGGETALRTGDGTVMKGCAVVMQGRYITHQALRALGAQERITMVTSFRPKSPHIKDESVLSTVRGISDLSELYYQYCLYRLEILEERVRDQLKRLREANTAGKKTDTLALKAFLETQERFLNSTNGEIVEDDRVVPGICQNCTLRTKSFRHRPRKWRSAI